MPGEDLGGPQGREKGGGGWAAGSWGVRRARIWGGGRQATGPAYRMPALWKHHVSRCGGGAGCAPAVRPGSGASGRRAAAPLSRRRSVAPGAAAAASCARPRPLPAPPPRAPGPGAPRAPLPARPAPLPPPASSHAGPRLLLSNGGDVGSGRGLGCAEAPTPPAAAARAPCAPPRGGRAPGEACGSPPSPPLSGRQCGDLGPRSTSAPSPRHCAVAPPG